MEIKKSSYFLSPLVLMHGGLMNMHRFLYVVYDWTKNQTRKKFISRKVLQLGVHHSILHL